MDAFNLAIDLLKQFQTNSSLDHRENQILNEVITRLRTGSERYTEIIKLNQELLENDNIVKQMRELGKEDNLLRILMENAGKDPKLDQWLKGVGYKIEKVQGTELRAHDLNNLDNLSAEESKKVRELHTQTETIYHNLWTTKTRLNQLSIFKNFNPKGVRGVRNDLISHTDNKRASNAYLYSFGLSSSGPVLRPTKPVGVKSINDAGLKPNVEEYIKSIVTILSINNN
jgi:hypothetical protein